MNTSNNFEEMAKALSGNGGLSNSFKDFEPSKKSEFASIEERPKNLYNCKRCGNTIVTEDKDEGTTPAFLPCKSFGGCSEGRMASMFYSVPRSLVASHKWVKNGDSETLQLKKKEPQPEPGSGQTSIHSKFKKGKK